VEQRTLMASRGPEIAKEAASPVHLVLRAALAAAHWHAKQRRKGTAGEPYINHLLEVATLVDEATGGRDPELVAAALLHDAIEDQGISRATIAEQFGEKVAALVEEVSDDKSLPQDVRKRLQVEQAATKSPRAKILKLADKISNVTAIGADPPPDWSVERQRQYLQWGRDVVAGLRGASPLLERRFDAAAAKAEQLIASR
jgi:(p)ppGpp synthase/HD superfamily hydrolase